MNLLAYNSIQNVLRTLCHDCALRTIVLQHKNAGNTSLSLFMFRHKLVLTWPKSNLCPFNDSGGNFLHYIISDTYIN